MVNRRVCDRDCLGKCEGKIGEELCTNDACTQGPGRYHKFCGSKTITTDGGESKVVSYCNKLKAIENELKAIENGDVFTWIRCDDCGKKRKIKGSVGSMQCCRNKRGKSGCGTKHSVVMGEKRHAETQAFQDFGRKSCNL